ncbi:replication protein A 14 kDa subunit-like [Limulus polyphemus]|uniref:Replication protein A 14 kDa subunit-like n=1 Tax=Limulus polyphemus TaxID=6850 RepID=A0ABM1B881_LIMPO|nr:replication protein A 14 kDa subunit-like [Limulus polyphemus]
MNLLETARHRVNASHLAQFQGKPICILGTVVQIDNSGKSFKMKSSDNQVITVIMEEPLGELLQGVIEVEGVVHNPKAVVCKRYFMFPQEAAEEFDINLHNEAVKLVNQYQNFYQCVTD